MAATISAKGWTDPRISGEATRQSWRQVQTGPSTFVWSYYDGVSQQAAKTGKKWSINIRGGLSGQPAWFLALKPTLFTVTASPNAIRPHAGGTFAPAWDQTLQRYWTALWQAIAARYDGDPNLSYVIFTGMGFTGQDTLCESAADNQELQQAGGQPAWQAAYLQLAAMFTAVFRQTPVIHNPGPIVYQNNHSYWLAADQILLKSTGKHYGDKDNALAANTKPTEDTLLQIKSEAAAGLPCGFQQLYPSKSQSDFTAAIKVGQTTGAKLFEIYPTDIAYLP